MISSKSGRVQQILFQAFSELVYVISGKPNEFIREQPLLSLAADYFYCYLFYVIITCSLQSFIKS